MFLKVKWSEVGYPDLTFCFSWQYPLQVVHPVCPWTFSLLPDAPTATPHTELMEIGIPRAFRCIPQKTWKKTLLEYSGLVKYQSPFQNKRYSSPLLWRFLERAEPPLRVSRRGSLGNKVKKIPNKGRIILTITASAKWTTWSSPRTCI